MDKLNSRESIELTVRVAQIIKQLSSLVGASDHLVIKLTLQDVIESFVELDKEVKKWGAQ